MAILKVGRGKPLTLFAPGGGGENLASRMSYTDRVKGTKIGFAYEDSGHFESIAKIRRQADRDAAEILALADEHKINRVVGFSRGARAIVGALAERPGAFERVVIVIPPRGVTAGKWNPWLESLSEANGRHGLAGDILVIADQIDAGHPVDVATLWARQLDARLEVLPRKTTYTDPDRVRDEIADFLN